MRGPRRSGERVVPGAGGMHVATVKKSTSLRMKKRGKVPPRLETLYHFVSSGLH